MKATVFMPKPYLPGKSNSLSDILNKIIAGLEHETTKKSSFIVNDVPEDILLFSNEDALSTVLEELVREIVGHTNEGCVRITAKIYHHLVLLHVKNDGNLDFDTVSLKLEKIQRQAQELGGFIGFTSYRNKLTTIAFSFVNARSATA